MAAITAQLALTVLMGLLLAGVVLWLTRIKDWRSYTLPASGGGTVSERSGYAHEEKPSGLIRWFTTVDHKDIGLMYGVYAILAFVVGGLMVMLMRTELIAPAEDVIGAQFYNSLLTSHGITMLFLFGTPIIAAVGNYFIPLLIDADDMAFPRINAIAFWLLPPGALLIWAGFFPIPDVIPAQTAWTMYTPLSAGVGGGTQGNVGVDLMLLGLHLTGVSATIGAINFIVTIFTERGEGVNWATLDIFSWTMLTQSGIILFAFPLLGSALIMLLLDRNFGTMFFTGEGGGPILWQHLFWFFGHPEVYILVIPPMGILSYIIPKFSGRKLFGFKYVVYSTLAIGVLSFGVWAHHMFTTGIDPRIRASFMAVSLAIAIPSAVKTFNWITTMWGGNVRLTAPMLFCIGTVFNFIIGGVTGVFLAAIPVTLLLHDTYYVVGHFHYIVMGMTTYTVFAAFYYWFPIITGKMYQRTLAKWHFWLSMIGTNLTFFSMLVLGYLGMPRRYATYDFPIGPTRMMTALHQVATLGALLIAVSTISGSGTSSSRGTKHRQSRIVIHGTSKRGTSSPTSGSGTSVASRLPSPMAEQIQRVRLRRADPDDRVGGIDIHSSTAQIASTARSMLSAVLPRKNPISTPMLAVSTPPTAYPDTAPQTAQRMPRLSRIILHTKQPWRRSVVPNIFELAMAGPYRQRAQRAATRDRTRRAGEIYCRPVRTHLDHDSEADDEGGSDGCLSHFQYLIPIS